MGPARNLHQAFYCERRKHETFVSLFEIKYLSRIDLSISSMKASSFTALNEHFIFFLTDP